MLLVQLPRDHDPQDAEECFLLPLIPGSAKIQELEDAIEVNGVAIETDDQGFLMDPEVWDDEVAGVLAHQAGVEFGDEHRKVLKFIRDYYQEHHIAVDARHVIRYIAEELGYNDKARKRLYELFPYGYMQQTCKIAGMRNNHADSGWCTGVCLGGDLRPDSGEPVGEASSCDL